jgi:hypothetical protein
LWFVGFAAGEPDGPVFHHEDKSSTMTSFCFYSSILWKNGLAGWTR